MNKAPFQINPDTPSQHIGLVSSRGGVCINDVPFHAPGVATSEVSSHIHVGTGGNVLLQMIDGTINPYLGVLDGTFIVAKATSLVGTAVIDGVSRSTTASNITWHGGQ